ncbi:hypothetical protein MBLNU13_g04230t1 [Cladosporium sp. NU13]
MSPHKVQQNGIASSSQHQPQYNITESTSAQGDLNNVASMRQTQEILGNPDFAYRSLAIPVEEDEVGIRANYRPFLLDPVVAEDDWVAKLELATVTEMAQRDLIKTGSRLKVLVLYGSLRQRSYSKLLAFEVSRILWRLGCDVRVYDPTGLPMKDDVQHTHPKVQELRDLSRWSDGHFWVSPEQHGNLTAVFKNQIDWIPLSTGSVRPTQGRTLGMAMVSGGSQSFNTVNSLRILGRWMRMFAIPNQSSIPKAYTVFTEESAPEGGSRLMEGGNRDRVVDCAEEFVKYTILMREHFGLMGDRFSEREERRAKEAKLKAQEEVK